MLMGKPRILLVDDETVTQQVLLGTLNRHGYECCVAQSTAEAEDLLNGQEFNLMVLDIMMPGKNGIDFLPEVVNRFRDMPVMMLTAVEETSIVVQAMRLGAYDYITKPVDLRSFNFRVENALEQRPVKFGLPPFSGTSPANDRPVCR